MWLRLLTVAVAMLAASAAAAHDGTLIITNTGIYVMVTTNGKPQEPVLIEQWWPGEILDLRNKEDPDDPHDPQIDEQVAQLVDRLADREANQDVRPKFAQVWSDAADAVTAGTISLTEARTSWIKDRHRQLLLSIGGGGWVPFCEELETQIDDLVRSGRFTVITLRSIADGLRR